MYNTLHTAAGALVAVTVFPGNWPAAFLLGWASHYILDAMPHGDDFSKELWSDRKRLVRYMAIWGGVDLLIVILLTSMWLFANGFRWVFLMAVFGAMLPDLMLGFSALIKKPGLLGFLGRFHTTAHNILDIKLPLWFGLGIQILLAGLLWWALLDSWWVIFR